MTVIGTALWSSPTWSKAALTLILLSGYVSIGILQPSFGECKLDSTKTMLMVLLAVAVSFSSLNTLFVSLATATVLAATLIGCLCGGGLWCAWIVLSSWPFWPQPSLPGFLGSLASSSLWSNKYMDCRPRWPAFFLQIPAHFPLSYLGFLSSLVDGKLKPPCLHHWLTWGSDPYSQSL